MDRQTLEFHVTGPDSEAIAAELSELLQRELNQRPSVRPGSQRTDVPMRTSPETLAWIGIVLMIPPAIQSTMSLAQQLKAVDRAKQIIAWAGQRLSGGNEIKVEGGGRYLGTLQSIDEAEIAEFLKRLEQNEESGRGQ